MSFQWQEKANLNGKSLSKPAACVMLAKVPFAKTGLV